tara:strand:- start:23 stop:397 length:375 start_codon:yes stop_codon:yes gene_type:complete
MKIKFEWSTREAYLLDKLEKNTIGKLKEATTKVKTKFQNIMKKLTTKTMTPEEYDNLWESIEDRLGDLYDNQPDAYDLENYEFELSGHEIMINEITMGYDHQATAERILKLLVEEGIIKIKNKK